MHVRSINKGGSQSYQITSSISGACQCISNPITSTAQYMLCGAFEILLHDASSANDMQNPHYEFVLSPTFVVKTANPPSYWSCWALCSKPRHILYYNLLMVRIANPPSYWWCWPRTPSRGTSCTAWMSTSKPLLLAMPTILSISACAVPSHLSVKC